VFEKTGRESFHGKRHSRFLYLFSSTSFTS
jgi:hypothetical protein